MRANAPDCGWIFAVLGLLTWLVGARLDAATGDEPHYLMTAHSLAVDGDISLLKQLPR